MLDALLSARGLVFTIIKLVHNFFLILKGVLYLKVVDPYNASYGVEDAEFAITQLAQTTMR